MEQGRGRAAKRDGRLERELRVAATSGSDGDAAVAGDHIITGVNHPTTHRASARRPGTSRNEPKDQGRATRSRCGGPKQRGGVASLEGRGRGNNSGRRAALRVTRAAEGQRRPAAACVRCLTSPDPNGETGRGTGEPHGKSVSPTTRNRDFMRETGPSLSRN
ncbi:hypothetical protein NDU88_000230 [Pleurodeles waltl]|uniref:Uncharacterized protein n=1 Tax=Pleurodeles waltl TaxID=8319 RepID=A0AAV7WIE5_PLEWA|nr:hypothetical protein NDU88_000230 [Pleurodeles waltl]